MKFNFEISGLPVLLTIVFVILKICGLVAWSWWWVFSPIVIMPLLGLCAAMILAVL